MKVQCIHCHKCYRIPDEKIPFGNKIAVSCSACQGRIIIDLRSKPTAKKPLIPSGSGQKPLVPESKPAKPYIRKQPSGMKLKYGILRTMADLPAMPKHERRVIHEYHHAPPVYVPVQPYWRGDRHHRDQGARNRVTITCSGSWD